MRRVIETTQSVRIGACIYCGTKGGTLHEEHITPYGLNGRLTLLEATCDDCAKRTSAFETTVLRKMLFAARAAIGTRTRRPKERLKPQPMLIEKNGEVEEVLALWQDQWKVIQLPIFDLPAYIDGREFIAGIECVSMDTFELGERGEDIAKRHGGTKWFRAATQLWTSHG